MAIDPVKIPQNVYVEDRIIGPVTLRQIMICLVGGAISYVIWSPLRASNIPTIQTAPAWTPLLIAAAFAFLKINGISLFRFCLLMLERSQKATVRKWTPRTGIAINFRIIKTKKEIEEEKKKEHEPVKESGHSIQELSALLDEGSKEMKEAQAQAQAEQEQAGAQEGAQDSKPVDPSRIKADDHSEESVDDISAPETTKAESAKGDVVRDIHPPSK